MTPIVAETTRMKRRLLKIRAMDWETIAINNADHSVFHLYRDSDATQVMHAFRLDPERKPVTYCYGEEIDEADATRIELDRDGELHPGNWPEKW